MANTGTAGPGQGHALIMNSVMPERLLPLPLDESRALALKSERPEKILVINCGSSSLKYHFYDTTDESRQARGRVERIGIEGTQLAHGGSGSDRSDVKRTLPKGGFS